MNHNIIIAQIGKLSYIETKYKDLDKENPKITKSRYSFEAVIWEILEDFSKEVTSNLIHVILVGTEDSYMGTVYEDFAGDEICSKSKNISLKNDIKKVKQSDGSIKEIVKEGKLVENINDCLVKESYEKDMSRFFTKYFNTNYNSHFNLIPAEGSSCNSLDFQVHIAIIEYGKTNKELQENYSILKDMVDSVIGTEAMEENRWDIYFDISNGFRSFPVYIYTLINYLIRIEKEAMRCHIYYGMFEAKQEDTDTSPLVNLQVIDDLLLLINAVSEFNNCGSVKQILELLKIHKEWNIQIGDKENETLSYAFEMFDYGTNANNLGYIETGINLLKNMQDEINSSDNGLNKAEKDLLINIAIDFSKRFPVNERYPYSSLMINMANWFYDMGRNGNAAIAAQETIWTYIMERYPDRTLWHLKMKNVKKVESISEPMDISKKNNDQGSLIFEYEIRDEISHLFNTNNHRNSESDKVNKFFELYNDNKKIRNPMAHFSYKLPQSFNDIGAGTSISEPYENIKKLIDCIDAEINPKEESEEISLSDQLADIIFEPEDEIQEWKTNYINRINHINQFKQMLENMELEIPKTDNFSILLEELRKEMQNEMNAYNGDYDAFRSRSEERCLLFKCFKEWIRGVMNKGPDYIPTDNDYKNFYKSDNNQSSGLERLKINMSNCNYLPNYVSILEEYSKLSGRKAQDSKCMNQLLMNKIN